MRNFQMLIVSVVKICKQYLQIRAFTLFRPEPYWKTSVYHAAWAIGLAPKRNFLAPPRSIGWGVSRIRCQTECLDAVFLGVLHSRTGEGLISLYLMDGVRVTRERTNTSPHEDRFFCPKYILGS